MIKVDNKKHLIKYLKNGLILTTNGIDSFCLDNNINRVIYNFNGNNVSISLNEFLDLFSKNVFYLKENKEIIVDDIKDIEYYSNLQRKN